MLCMLQAIHFCSVDKLTQLALFELDNEKRAEQERPIFVIMKLFEQIPHSFFSEEVVFIKKIVV